VRIISVYKIQYIVIEAVSLPNILIINQIRNTKTVSMDTTFKILFLVLVIVLISNMVISDRLFIEFNPNDSEINLLYNPSIELTSADSTKINLKPIILLLCIGLVGIVVFGRQRIGDKNDDKDITKED
jgi:hypothetical protein